MSIEPKKNPLWFSIVAVIAIVWNLIGVLNYLQQVTMSEEAKLLMDPELLAFIENLPKLLTATFAVGVWFGFVGSILLLLKKARALLFFGISIIAVIFNTAYTIFFTNGVQIVGAESYYGLQSTIIIVAIALVYLSKKAIANRWIS